MGVKKIAPRDKVVFFHIALKAGPRGLLAKMSDRIAAVDFNFPIGANWMSEPITPELFNHLVELAALELSPEEGEYLRRQLNNQLKAIHELEAIPLDASTPVTSHGVLYSPEITPALRSDDWQPYPQPEDILAQAPETEDGYIIVPEIPHTELE
jgi:aspartyl/glutamyl-tRNA(Asn/Gln) amidotransferase C subunit